MAGKIKCLQKQGARRRAPLRRPECCKQERSETLPGGLLCDWAAQLKRPVFFPAAGYQSNNGAKKRHGCDFFGHGDPHHCHAAFIITCSCRTAQYMIDVRCYFVNSLVHGGHGECNGIPYVASRAKLAKFGLSRGNGPILVARKSTGARTLHGCVSEQSCSRLNDIRGHVGAIEFACLSA